MAKQLACKQGRRRTAADGFLETDGVKPKRSAEEAQGGSLGSADPTEVFIERNVREHGWAVNLIGAGDGPNEPAFAYTVGLFRNYSQPELIILGQPPRTMHCVLNALGDRVKAGKRFVTGERIGEILEGCDVLIREVRGFESYRDHVGYALWFYQGPSFPLFQVVWPDRNGRFPGDPNVVPGLEGRQPLLP